MIEPILLTDNVKICVMCLYAFLFLMHIGAIFLKLLHKNVDNFLIRMKSFWFIVVLFTAPFILNKLVSFFFIGLLSYLALKEYFSMIPTRRVDRRVLLWAYLAIPISFYFIYIRWVTMFYLFIPLYMFILIPIRMILVKETQGFLKACGTIHWGLMATVYSLGYLALYIIFPNIENPKGGGIGLLMYVLVMTISNDFMQYLFGKCFGKHKIVPTISPNKTWEGFLGGVFSSIIISMILSQFLTPMDLLQGGFIGFVLALAGFMGDVTMSAIKRDIGVKDTGTLLPGHGGVLDRFDSLIFTAPLFFHYIVYVFSVNILK